MSKNIESRWSNNGARYKNSTYFNHAIEKYGWDNFEHIILIDNLSKEVACIVEKELIKKYKTQNQEFGYNISDGGLGGPILKGRDHHNSKPVYQYDLKGIFIKEWENAQRASEEFGIIVSDIHKNCRCEDGVKRAGKYMWSYVKVECMEPYNRIGFCFEPILQLDKNFNIVYRYDCIRSIDGTVYNKEKITYCCTRKNLTHLNYYWCYEKDFSDEFIEYVKNRISNKNKNLVNRVFQCDLNLNIIKIFKDAYEVEKMTGRNNITIRAYCKRPEMNHGIHTGYIWVYEKDYEKLKEEEISIKEKYKKYS